MLKIVLCDDNIKLLSSMSCVMEKIIKNTNINAEVVYTCTSTIELDNYLKHNKPNVFFLDIDLNSAESGFDYALKIRERDRNAYILFITGHLQYVFQSFKIRPFNFIPKPITKGVLEMNLIQIYEDYVEQTPKISDNCIEIKYNNVVYKIKQDDIVYIEKINSKSFINLTNNKLIQCSETLEHFENLLSEKNFIRCHKSFICNREFISQIKLKDNQILFESGQTCSIGRKFRKGLV